MKQDLLLSVVRTWKINPKPEYRGFRCASCQRYLYSSWHHWLNSGGYKIPVHLCQSCEKKSCAGKLKNRLPRRTVVRSRFYTNLPKKVKTRLKAIVRSWRLPKKAVRKRFSCDTCRTHLHRAYHVGTNVGRNLVETHFCKRCGDRLFSQSK